MKIRLEDLNKGSTPCEICVALNDREVEKNDSGKYFSRIYCTEYTADGGSACTDAQKSIIKLLYLKNKKESS